MIYEAACLNAVSKGFPAAACTSAQGEHSINLPINTEARGEHALTMKLNKKGEALCAGDKQASAVLGNKAGRAAVSGWLGTARAALQGSASVQ